MAQRSEASGALALFDELQASRDPGSQALVEAERLLQELADTVYTRAGLKPMSKALYFVSRALLATAHSNAPLKTASEVSKAYGAVKGSLGPEMVVDDYSFDAVLADCSQVLPELLAIIGQLRKLTSGADVMGMAFDTLLRGKWQGGEGLGTYLTPEEIARPMVAIASAALSPALRARIGVGPRELYVGDICGGTGRFMFAAARELRDAGLEPPAIANACRLFDQSSLAVSLAQINLLLDGLHSRFAVVADSIIADDVSKLRGKFALLATNPPFGSGKYVWHNELPKLIAPSVLTALGLGGRGMSTDPAGLFFFRNVDLLAEGGVLAIVLPDGVVHSDRFAAAWRAYEEESGRQIELVALVSLPAAAFALGGTVAKTSFLVVRTAVTGPRCETYTAKAEHIGFVKRGNSRSPDKHGNDLDLIVNEFQHRTPDSIGRRIPGWNPSKSLVGALSASTGTPSSLQGIAPSLNELTHAVRVYTEHVSGGAAAGRSFHISILDVDETGLIDLRAAMSNSPVTKSLACKAGDVLVSCLNPKIWRVALVPELGVNWTCSPEFVALRPRPGVDARRLTLSLFAPSVRASVVALGTGTSSSRQRVDKARIGSIAVPLLGPDDPVITQHFEGRLRFYRQRLEEITLFEQLHCGTYPSCGLGG